MLLLLRKHLNTFCAPLWGVVFIVFTLLGCNHKQGSNQETALSDAQLDTTFTHLNTWLVANKTTLTRRYLDSLYSTYENISDAQKLRKYHFLANMYLYNTKDLALVKNYLDSSKVLLKTNLHLKKDQLRYYFLKSNYHIVLQEFDLATNALFKGKSIIEQSDLHCEGGGFANSLGYLLYQQGRYADALTAFQWRHELNLECKKANDVLPVFNLQLDYNEMGLCYENMGLYDSAIAQYSQGISLIQAFQQEDSVEAAKLERSLGVIIGNKGSAYAKMQLYDSAIHYLKQSIAINYSPDREMQDAILCKIKLANCYIETQQLASAEALIQEASEYLINKPSLLAELRLTEVQKNYHVRVRNFEKAYTYSALEQSLRDSMHNFQLTKSSQFDYKLAFNNLKKEVDVLNLQNANAQKNFYIVLISAALLISISIGIAAVAKRKREQKFSKRLQTLNKATIRKNEELLQSLQNLQQSYNDNARIMKILAHDLRSPMAGILSSVQLLQHGKMSAADQKELLQLMEKSSENALDFIKDILQLNALDKPSDYVKQDVAAVLLSCLQLLKHEAEKKQQQLHTQLISVYVPLNQQKIWRVFNNLINNAIKFSSQGQSIVIEVTESPTDVVIAVRDQGIGIAENRKTQLFDMFEVEGKKGTSGERSYGLGLAISKQIVLAHQGEIWLESTEHVGSTFYVKLPKYRR